jgi:putative sugar O-methyltransferase
MTPSHSRQRMDKLNVDRQVAMRLGAFIDSDFFLDKNDISKSDYWRYHAKRLTVEIERGSVNVGGESGFYVPEPISLVQRSMNKALRGLKDPSAVARWARRIVMSGAEIPVLLPYAKAFDAAMSHDEVSDPDLSPFRINHLELAKIAGTLATAKDVATHYQSWSGYSVSENIFNHYYHQNILRAYVDRNSVHTVMEIGAGNGNFASILFHDWNPVQMIIVDLPETLAVSIPFLSSLFPQAKIVMPHEIASGFFNENFDFAFLTPHQIGLIPDNLIDLSINCHSFQEMTHEQIRSYFTLVQRTTRETGIFFAANRVEKIPGGPDSFSIEQTAPPNRFSEYPWNDGNDVLVYEISRLSRLVQLDNIAIRLERIHK